MWEWKVIQGYIHIYIYITMCRYMNRLSPLPQHIHQTYPHAESSSSSWSSQVGAWCTGELGPPPAFSDGFWAGRNHQQLQITLCSAGLDAESVTEPGPSGKTTHSKATEASRRRRWWWSCWRGYVNIYCSRIKQKYIQECASSGTIITLPWIWNY